MLDFLVLALAIWRMALLLAVEPGPFDIFGKIREWSGVRYTAARAPIQDDDTPELAKMITCIWCNSIWIALALGLLYQLAPVVVIIFCFPLALSAGAILMEIQRQ